MSNNEFPIFDNKDSRHMLLNVWRTGNIIIIIIYSLFTGFSWYFSSWTNGEPHHSGFKFLIVALPLYVWCS
jgi:hypothetical protein